MPATTRSRTRERLTLTVVVLASALMAIDMLIVTVALPEIGRGLGADGLAGLQWVVVGYSLAFGALIQPAASLSDRIGTRRLFLGGMILFTLSSLACGIAPDILLLNLFRIVQGAAAAIMFANAMPLLARTFPEERRAMAIGVWSGVVGVCSIASPVLGGFLVDLFGWRSMFLMNVPLGIVAVIISARVLPHDVPDVKPSSAFDVLGAILLAAALVCLNGGITIAQEAGILAAPVLALLAGFVVLLACFVVRALRTANPVLDVRLLADSTFLGVSLLAVLNRVGTAGATVYIMLYLQNGHGLTPLQTGLLLLPLGLASLCGSLWAGRLQATVRPRTVLALGFLLLGVGAALIAWQSASVQSPWLLVPATMVWGLGNAFANTPLMNVATRAVPIERVGMATGFVNSSFPIGAALGTVLLGAVFSARIADTDTASVADLGGAVGVVYLLVAIACAVAVLLSLVLLRRDRVS